MKSATTKVLWGVYICLLLVLLPHTAWAFESMEPNGNKLTAWTAAIAFEAAIAVLTHKLAKHIEGMKRGKNWWAKFSYQYLNAYAFGLFAATGVSALANLAHAVEFGKPLVIFTQWNIPQGVYSVAFGGVLPLVSLIFARVLSNATDDEDTPNPELDAAKMTIAELRKQVRESELRAKAAEDRMRTAEDRFGALGDLVKYLFGEDKKQRIIFARRQWERLPGSSIAILTETSPAYVSEVLSEMSETRQSVIESKVVR